MQDPDRSGAGDGPDPGIGDMERSVETETAVCVGLGIRGGKGGLAVEAHRNITVVATDFDPVP